MISALMDWKERHARFSAKLWGVLSCLVGSFLFVLFQGGKLSLMVFIIVSILSLYLVLGKWSGVASAQGTRILANIEQDMVVDAGTSVSVAIRLQVPGIWPLPYVIIRDRLSRRKGETHTFITSTVPDWKRRGRVDYHTPPLRRGYYHFEAADCSTEDVFGLFEHKGTMSLSYSFCVKPQTIPIREWRQFHQLLKGRHHHSTTTRAVRETTQINGVREYIYGDRISRIHWNATARTGTWKSKEFERESLPKTVIMIDRNMNSYESKEQFELAVSTAASLFEYGQQKDMALGLLSVGADSTYFEPTKSPQHHKSIFNHLIEAEADGHYSMVDVVKDRARQLSQGCFFVLISPLKGEAMLPVLHWINHRQMNPCHLWICSQTAAPVPEEWLKQLRSLGYMGYGIHSLQELPIALGGRA